MPSHFKFIVAKFYTNFLLFENLSRAPLLFSVFYFSWRLFSMFGNSYLSSHVPAWILMQTLWDSWVCSSISFSVTRQIILSGGPLTISMCISFPSFSRTGSFNFFVRKHKPGCWLSKAGQKEELDVSLFSHPTIHCLWCPEF